MASTDARPIPRKNVAYRHYFAIRKNDGSLITTWAGMDSEVNIDGDVGGFVDATNEATEIGTSGCGYIDLTAGEMNGDAVMLKVTVTNTDALPYVVTFFPEEVGDLRADAVQLGGSTQSATDLKDFADTGYDPAAHKVQGVVLTDACTTNTDMRGTNNAYTGTPPTATAIKNAIEAGDLAAVKTQTDKIAHFFNIITTISSITDSTHYKLAASYNQYSDFTNCDVTFIAAGEGNARNNRKIISHSFSEGYITIEVDSMYSATAGDIVIIWNNTQKPVELEVGSITGDSISAAAVTKIQSGLAVPGSKMNLVDGALARVKIANGAFVGDIFHASAVGKIQAGLAVPGSAMTLTEAYDAAKTAAQAGDAMTLAAAAIKAASFDENILSATPLPVNVTQWKGTAPNDLSDGKVSSDATVELNEEQTTEIAGTVATAVSEGLGIVAGDIDTTITIRDINSQLMDNVKVWVNTANVRSGSVVLPQVSNMQGRVTFSLSAGIYYVFAAKIGYSFSTSNHDIEVAVGSDSFTLDLGSIVVLPETGSGIYDESFISRSLNTFKASVDEPTLNAKYTDAVITSMFSNSYSQLLSEVSRLSSTPIVLQYTVELVRGVTRYHIPANRNTVYAIYEQTTDTSCKVYFSDSGRYNIQGRGVRIEGNTLIVDSNLVTTANELIIEYVPSGITKFVEGAISTVSEDGDEVILELVPNQGIMSRSPSDYAGAIFRVLGDTDDSYNLIQERTILEYDPLTRKVVLDVALDPNPGDGVHDGTTFYEIVPSIGRHFDSIIPLHAAWSIANREGMRKRAAGLQTEYITALRNLRLNSFYSNLDSAIKLDKEVYDGLFSNRRFRDGRHI